MINIVSVQAEGREFMLSYEEQIFLQSIQGLISYSKYLADTNLDSNRKRIEQIGKLVEGMALYGGIAQEYESLGVSAKETFEDPVKQLLAGKNVTTIPKFNGRFKANVLEGLQYLKKELIMDRDPAHEEDINLCRELIREITYEDGEFYKIFDAVRGLESYVGALAAVGIEEYRDEIEKVQDLIEQMAAYGAITGSEKGAYERIKEKYLDPITRLLDGEQDVSFPDYTEQQKESILRGIQYYQKELEAEFGSESESDIRLCDEIMQNMAEDSPEWTQIQLH